MSKIPKSLATVFAAISIAFGLTACSSEPVDTSNVTAIIDVRTSAEYAEGHLDGAVNIDVESSDFSAKISTLEKTGKYLIYCRSGRRADMALEQMKALGFSNLSNIGGLSEAASVTGLDIVQ